MLLGLAAVAVAFAAADTYVVVLALPEMMGATGIPIDQLQRAAPIISGFLLGYVAMLPLIGRIADLRGRVPVLVAALVIFAVGSLVTALAYDLPSMVVGRFLQGVGGGGLVPGHAGAGRRPLPRRAPRRTARHRLGRAGARLRDRAALRRAGDLGRRLAHDLPDQPGRRAGPRGRAARRRRVDGGRRTSHPSRAGGFDWGSPLLLLIALVFGVLVFVQPNELVTDLTWGDFFIPFAGDSRWLTPVGAVAIVAFLLFLVRSATASRPMVDLAGWARTAREADLRGALSSPSRSAASSSPSPPPTRRSRCSPTAASGTCSIAAVATVAFVLHLRSAENAAGPAGGAPPDAGLGRDPGELLRRLGAHRGAHRHPDLRPHHDVPRPPS